MAVNKKISTSKSPDKRSPQDPGTAPKNGQPVARAGSDAGSPQRLQMDAFEEGMRQFHARQFQAALDKFRAASSGPDRAVSHRAGLHARMCESRLVDRSVVLSTPEDHYNYAITLINARDLAGAQKHLRTALEGAPDSDHILYALAVALGLTGDLAGAYENLKRAIDLQPRNRLAARQDPDLAHAAQQPLIAGLLFPDRR